MTWAYDPRNIVHMLALGTAEREFGDYIEQGIGTRETLANVYLVYTGRHPDWSMERCTAEMRRDLDRWIARGGLAAARKALEQQVRELGPGSSSET